MMKNAMMMMAFVMMMGCAASSNGVEMDVEQRIDDVLMETCEFQLAECGQLNTGGIFTFSTGGRNPTCEEAIEVSLSSVALREHPQCIDQFEAFAYCRMDNWIDCNNPGDACDALMAEMHECFGANP